MAPISPSEARRLIADIKETLALFGVDQFLAYYKDEKSAMEDR